MKKAKFVLMTVLLFSLLVVSAASAQTLPPPSAPPPTAPFGDVTGTGDGSIQPVPTGIVVPPAPTGQEALSDAFLVAVVDGGSMTVCVDIPAGHHNSLTLRFLGGDGKWHAVPTTISGDQACGVFTVPSVVQLQGW